MYSYEIEELLKKCNYNIDSETFINMCRTSPQIDHIKYNPYEDNIEMWTNDNYNVKIKVYKIERDYNNGNNNNN